MKIDRALLAMTLALSLAMPVLARGGGFGGFHDGGFGGYHEGGYDRGGWGGHGFDHSFGSGNFADFDRGFDRGAFTPGGVEHMSPGTVAGNHQNLGSDGGFGGAAAEGRFNNAHVNEFDGNHMNMQGEAVRNSFDHDTTINNFNSYGHNNIGNGYHADAYGYHPYGAYGYHGYGYGYHPYGYGYHYGFYGYPGGWYAPGFMEASMWTFMGMSTMVDFLGLEALSGSNKKSTTNITYQGDNVCINGVPQSQYYAQAQQLAATANATTAAANATAAAANATAAVANLEAGSPLAQLIQQRLGKGVAPATGTGAGTAPALGTVAGIAGRPGLANAPRLAELAKAAGTSGLASGNAPDLSALSAAPSSSPAEKWEPLGVYSLVEPGQKESTTLFQLAINKEGIIRGNYMNQITNERSPLQGALDKKTGQISWYVGNNPTTVFETNFQEIAKKDSKVVVQFGAEQTQQMALIRLPKPAEPKHTDGALQNQDSNEAAPSGT
jgi:hypothetical protein